MNLEIKIEQVNKYLLYLVVGCGIFINVINFKKNL